MPKSKYTKALLNPIVKRSKAFSEVCRELGIKPNAGGHSYIANKIRELGIDTSHFIGNSWNLGRTFPHLQKTNDEFFVKNSGSNTHSVRVRLLKRGIKKKKCEVCGLKKWLNKPIPLEVHHINGDRTDNRLGNLQIICRNCHYFTPNYRIKNKRN